MLLLQDPVSVVDARKLERQYIEKWIRQDKNRKKVGSNLIITRQDKARRKGGINMIIRPGA